MACQCCCECCCECKRELRQMRANRLAKTLELLRPQRGQFRLAEERFAWRPIRCPKSKRWFWLQPISIYEVSDVKICYPRWEYYLVWNRSHILLKAKQYPA
jgi:hypothetical protein